MDESVKTKAVRKLCSQCGQQYPADANVCQLDGAELLSLPIIQKLPESEEDLLAVGTVLGDRYEILSVIGSGGMGIVYKARHQLMDRLVAVKMLNQETIADEQLLTRFQQEAKTASMLSHPNIVAVFDYGVLDSKPYLVMDYVEGHSLEDLIAEGPVPLNRYFSLFSQAADALSHAHQKGVVHRDIKPSNIMIERNDIDPNCVRVVDFGIAKLMRNKKDSGEQKITRSGEVLGSAPYMSPEQCMGQEIGIASDIYSLGCVMYEALSGQPPAQGKNTLDTIYKQINDEPLPLRTVRSDVQIPEAIESVVMKALRKDPNRRFANMYELNAALEEAFKPVKPALPSEERTAATPEAPPRLSLLKQLRPLIAALIALPLICGVVYLTAGEGTLKAKQLEARLAVQEATMGPSSPALIPLLVELSAEYRNYDPSYIGAIRVQERLTRLTEKHRPHSPELSRAKLDLAEMFSRRNNLIRAKVLREESLQVLQNHLASLPDNGPEKEAVLKQVSQLARNVHGANSLEYADAITTNARFQARAKDWRNADAAYAEALKIHGQIFGETSDKYADALEEYAGMLVQAHNFRKAPIYLQNVLDIREKLHGKESALSVRSNRALGKLYQDMGRTADAESCLLAAIASQGAVTGPESQEVAPILTDLAAVYEAQHNAKQARDMYKLAVTIQDNLKDPDKQQLAATLEGLARACADEKDLSGAEAALTRAVIMREPSGGAPLSNTLKALAKVLEDEHKSREAKLALTRAAALEAQK
jgi:serine/threonine protein kinase